MPRRSPIYLTPVWQAQELLGLEQRCANRRIPHSGSGGCGFQRGSAGYPAFET